MSIENETFLGYTYQESLDLAEQIYGLPCWNSQMVLNDLEWCWSNALDEAKIGQGSSSKDIRKEQQLIVIREFCYLADKYSGVPTDWYEQNLKDQQLWMKAIDDAWAEAMEEAERYAEELRLKEEEVELELEASRLNAQWSDAA